MNSDKLQRRTREILSAAQKVFAAKGFHDATVAEVAREAGVSEKTVYEYFPSKEELLFQIPVAPTLEGLDELEKVLQHVRGAGNKIRSIISHYISFYVDHREYATVILLSLRRRSGFTRTETFERLRTSYRVIDKAVEEGVAAGEFAAGTSPELVRWAVMGSLEYILARWLQQGEPEDPRAWVDPLADLIVRGISRPAGAGEWTLRIAVEPAAGDGARLVVTPSEGSAQRGGNGSGGSTKPARARDRRRAAG